MARTARIVAPHFPHHITQRGNYGQVVFEIDDWREYLSVADDEKVTGYLRACTLTGRPAGGDSFVKGLEKLLGRDLRVKPVGRPRKKK